tara:strand:+ start:17689 stop:18030 length:342 start_codon:yes stop_codon:yes gene_type:complete
MRKLFLESILNWDNRYFDSIFNKEINNLSFERLQLLKAMKNGSYLHDEPVKTIILNKEKNGQYAFIKTGVFFYSSIGGCNCSDEAVNQNNLDEYCELLLKLKADGQLININLV